MTGAPLPLSGVRVLELGHLIAGPFCGTLLGYFGADVIKIEPPKGDPIRGWRGLEDGGTSLWWRSVGRNKRCVVIDLASEDGAALVSRLLRSVDVVVENFRPGRLAEFGIDLAAAERDNPGLIVSSVSGYGQSGPLRGRPGYASVCEAFGGLRHVTGEPGEPPVRANLSLGDSLAGLYAALGVVMALFARDRSGGTGVGQRVDTAIYESVFSMLESVVPEYDRLGDVRGPSGTTITGVVPTGLYRCQDGHSIVIGANSERLFRCLCEAIEQPAMADDPRFSSNERRVDNAADIEAAIKTFAGSRAKADVLAVLEAAGVPCSGVFTAADIAADDHYRARGMIESVQVDGEPLALGGFAPRLPASPGRTEWAGPALGAHTDEVLADVLAMSTADIAALRERGVVA